MMLWLTVLGLFLWRVRHVLHIFKLQYEQKASARSLSEHPLHLVTSLSPFPLCSSINSFTRWLMKKALSNSFTPPGGITACFSHLMQKNSDDCFCSFSRHSSQKKWWHGRYLGLLKSLQHKGHVRLSTDINIPLSAMIKLHHVQRQSGKCIYIYIYMHRFIRCTDTHIFDYVLSSCIYIHIHASSPLLCTVFYVPL